MELNFRVCEAAELSRGDFRAKIVNFLYEHLDEFRDAKEDIAQCLEYVNKEPGESGKVFLCQKGDEIQAVVVLNRTYMENFIPNYLLVYIATHKDVRGQGVGGKLISLVQKTIQAPIALHVEHENPAKKLYAKLGFTNKYTEMRWYP